MSLSVAQQNISIHQEQHTYHKGQNISAKDYYSKNKISQKVVNRASEDCELNKMVFGWHPYWQNGYEDNYDWNLISDFCYFSYEVDPLTGNASTTHDFETIAAVTEALNSGTRVHLCVTLFNGHATFLNNVDAKQNLIDQLILKIQARSAHGVNIDFESIPSSHKDNLSNFMIDLSQQMHAAIPGSIVSIDIPAVDWNATFNVDTMSDYVDYFMIMGYDYYWGGSDQAGPHSPLYTFNNNYDYNLSKTISYYTHAGAPEEKLLLGVPYYGRKWTTESDNIPSSTIGSGTAVTYKSIQNNSSDYYSIRLWDDNSKNPYYVYNEGDWHQCFSDDEESLALRYDMVHYRDLAGIAIWALGYDDGYTQLWDAISEKLTDCRTVSCADTIYDMGGPNHNYYNFEDYIYTIAPDEAEDLKLTFLEFELENEWDTLWIYDGIDINAPEIGNYTGTNSPGLVLASNAALTLKFHSDIATTAPGFVAAWNCDLTAETEEITEREKSFSVYPNPAKGYVVVEGCKLKVESVAVYDLMGKLIRSIPVKELSEKFKIDVSDLQSGIYLLKVGELIEKLVVE